MPESNPGRAAWATLLVVALRLVLIVGSLLQNLQA
jgi:hypothetical protein